jgi:hypothetical protein
MDMRFGTWNVRCIPGRFAHDSGKEISKYKLDFVGVQVRWNRGGTKPACKYTFFYRKGNENHDRSLGHKRIISSVQRVEFVSDRMLY